MTLLLDTHAFLWYYPGSSEMSKYAISAIENRNNDFVISMASLWETYFARTSRHIFPGYYLKRIQHTSYSSSAHTSICLSSFSSQGSFRSITDRTSSGGEHSNHHDRSFAEIILPKFRPTNTLVNSAAKSPTTPPASPHSTARPSLPGSSPAGLWGLWPRCIQSGV